MQVHIKKMTHYNYIDNSQKILSTTVFPEGETTKTREEKHWSALQEHCLDFLNKQQLAQDLWTAVSHQFNTEKTNSLHPWTWIKK